MPCICRIALFVLVLLSEAAVAAAENWPQEIRIPEGVIVIYQPQPERLEGNRLEGRAAVGVELKGATEPVYGVIWFDARIDTDRAERTVVIVDVSIPRVRFPVADEQQREGHETVTSHPLPEAIDSDLEDPRRGECEEIGEDQADATDHEVGLVARKVAAHCRKRPSSLSLSRVVVVHQDIPVDGGNSNRLKYRRYTRPDQF